ncbi:MAG: hypothetical protein JW801_15915 [Bacteroidales bacterium]|nr:hypothetical protein [Bacteroidales bacterium]
MIGSVLLTTSICLQAREDRKFFNLNPAIPVNTLFLNTDYTSQRSTNTYIIDELKQPYLNAGISYFSRKNFDFSLQAGMAFNSDTGYSEPAYELDLSAGYTFNLGNYVKLRPAYSHFLFSKNSHELQSLFSDMLQLDLYWAGDYYYGGLFNSYLFGEKDVYYSTIQNGVSYYKEKTSGRNTSFSLGIELSLNFSDPNYYNSILWNSWNDEEFAYWLANYHNELYGGDVELVFHQFDLYGYENVKAREEQLIALQYDGIFDRSFGLSYINLSIPVTFSPRSLGFYLLPTLMLPVSSSIFYDPDVQFIMSLGMSLSIR